MPISNPAETWSSRQVNSKSEYNCKQIIVPLNFERNSGIYSSDLWSRWMLFMIYERWIIETALNLHSTGSLPSLKRKQASRSLCWLTIKVYKYFNSLREESESSNVHKIGCAILWIDKLNAEADLIGNQKPPTVESTNWMFSESSRLAFIKILHHDWKKTGKKTFWD